MDGILTAMLLRYPQGEPFRLAHNDALAIA
jgi:hypothetical protein